MRRIVRILALPLMALLVVFVLPVPYQHAYAWEPVQVLKNGEKITGVKIKIDRGDFPSRVCRDFLKTDPINSANCGWKAMGLSGLTNDKRILPGSVLTFSFSPANVSETEEEFLEALKEAALNVRGTQPTLSPIANEPAFLEPPRAADPAYAEKAEINVLDQKIESLIAVVEDLRLALAEGVGQGETSIRSFQSVFSAIDEMRKFLWRFALIVVIAIMVLTLLPLFWWLGYRARVPNESAVSVVATTTADEEAFTKEAVVDLAIERRRLRTEVADLKARLDQLEAKLPGKVWTYRFPAHDQEFSGREVEFKIVSLVERNGSHEVVLSNLLGENDPVREKNAANHARAYLRKHTGTSSRSHTAMVA